MAYRKYKIGLFARIFFLMLAMIVLAFVLTKLNFNEDLPLTIVVVLPLVFMVLFIGNNLSKYVTKRFDEMDDFFESVKYRDFSRWFTEKSGAEDIRELHKGFNEVNKTIKEINREKEAQHLYLQKILELIDTGIIAYNIATGKVLWVNHSFKKNLSVPSIKNIQFIKERQPELYQSVFETNHSKGSSITLNIDYEKVKVLIASSIFYIEEEAFKLIVLQNINETLNRNESEAWKKLLSVMTHEIMNSIAPISSLAETLLHTLKSNIDDAENNPLEVQDLNLGISSIKSRSEGLLKFAQTYRSLNKATKLNLKETQVSQLFENISTLMKPSLDKKNISLEFKLENSDLKVMVDHYLIEQILINLVLNAIEAVKEREQPKITLSAKRSIEGNVIVKVIDNGKGIPNEIIEDVFVPFFSTKKNGSGIGLSLCKQIMMLHKGKIQIKSIPNEGTAIFLVF